MKNLPIFIAALILVSCADRKSEIEKAMRQYDHLTFQMNADSLAESYLPTGVLSGKGMKKFEGRDSIREFLKSFSAADIHLISNSTSVESITFSGDTAMVLGSYEQKAKLSQGDTGVYTGKLTAKWLKAGNRWLIANLYTTPQNPIASIKTILLRELRTTHNQKEWFVPAKVALEGLTAKQAMWKDGSGNHSAGQLAYHLAFWNERLLKRFNNEQIVDFTGGNNETFDKFDEKQWSDVVKKLDDVIVAWETAIRNSNEQKLSDWQESITNMCTHNAYHTGQIIFLRKLQGSWDPEKGVK
ncbi:MAG TPA: DinB family protein [Cyclobacteriaceae bacterium]|nr:DinB family protein [Cyclobacteriaceae bacterium]